MFIELEAKLQLNQSDTAKFLGIAKSTYSEYRSGKRTTPVYIEYYVDVIMMLPARKVLLLKSERL